MKSGSALAEGECVIAEPGHEATRVTFQQRHVFVRDRLADDRGLGFVAGTDDFMQQQALAQDRRNLIGDLIPARVTAGEEDRDHLGARAADHFRREDIRQASASAGNRLGGKADSKPEEARAIRRAFDVYDYNSDGEISFLDLKKAMTEQGQSISEKDIHEWIKRRDTKGKGTVDLEDFVRAYRSTSKSNTK